MFPPKFAQSRYLRSARRAHITRVAAAGALVVLPSACGGSGDAAVFGTPSDTVAGAPVDTTNADTTNAATGTTIPGVDDTTTTPSSSTPAAPATTPATAPATTPATVAETTTTFPAGAEMVVDFTFRPGNTGRANNPYVAVWVEDTDGNLVQTVSLWYEQSGKGTKWLRDLRQWNATAAGTEVTTSGATRSAGSYSVVWDGTDIDGNLVAQGDYVLYVEAAREHGPYEITSSPITVSNDGFSVTLADDGELSALSATMTV